jgi:hypothetical protein
VSKLIIENKNKPYYTFKDLEAGEVYSLVSPEDRSFNCYYYMKIQTAKSNYSAVNLSEGCAVYNIDYDEQVFPVTATLTIKR